MKLLFLKFKFIDGFAKVQKQARQIVKTSYFNTLNSGGLPID
jgi:hypothetical protein